MAYEENHNKLIDAIQDGCTDKATLRQFIENVKDPDHLKWATEGRNISPIGACVKNGNMEALDMLLAHGAPVNMPSYHIEFTQPKQSPLEVAITFKQHYMLSKLLKAGADCRDESYISQAMFRSDRELCCLKILLEHIGDLGLSGENDNLRPTGRNFFCFPLNIVLDHELSKSRFGEEMDDDDLILILEDVSLVTDIVGMIINLGFPLDTSVTSCSDCEIGPEYNLRPIELAIINQHLRAGILLIQAGCSVKDNDSSQLTSKPDVLMLSLIYQTLPLVHILISAGVQVTQQHISTLLEIRVWEDFPPDHFHEHKEKPLSDDARELFEFMETEKCNPASLKRQCRVAIRDHLREITNHRPILPNIEQLPLPTCTKKYLALEIL